jgi:hypothetical protein
MKKETLFLCLVWTMHFSASSFALSPSDRWRPSDLGARPTSAPIHYKIIAFANHSFGYDIYSNGKILVHQVSIPGLPGNQGFTRRKDAEKVAALVVKKLEKNIMPPTVTRAEMDELKIKY